MSRYRVVDSYRVRAINGTRRRYPRCWWGIDDCYPGCLRHQCQGRSGSNEAGLCAPHWKAVTEPGSANTAAMWRPWHPGQ